MASFVHVFVLLQYPPQQGTSLPSPSKERPALNFQRSGLSVLHRRVNVTVCGLQNESGRSARQRTSPAPIPAVLVSWPHVDNAPWERLQRVRGEDLRLSTDSGLRAWQGGAHGGLHGGAWLLWPQALVWEDPVRAGQVKQGPLRGEHSVPANPGKGPPPSS